MCNKWQECDTHSLKLKPSSTAFPEANIVRNSTECSVLFSIISWMSLLGTRMQTRKDLYINVVVIFHWFYLCLHTLSPKFFSKMDNTLHHSKQTALSITSWPNLWPSLSVLILLIVYLNETWDSREYQGNSMEHEDKVFKRTSWYTSKSFRPSMCSFWVNPRDQVQTQPHTKFICNMPLTPKYQAR